MGISARAFINGMQYITENRVMIFKPLIGAKLGFFEIMRRQTKIAE